MDDEIEYTVDSDEFDDRDVDELDRQLAAAKPASENEQKKLKLTLGQEDINFGPSTFQFLADHQRKEDERVEEDDALEDRWRKLPGNCDPSSESPTTMDILSLTDEQKAVCRNALIGVPFRPRGVFSRVFSAAKRVSGESSMHELPDSKADGQEVHPVESAMLLTPSPQNYRKSPPSSSPLNTCKISVKQEPQSVPAKRTAVIDRPVSRALVDVTGPRQWLQKPSLLNASKISVNREPQNAPAKQNLAISPAGSGVWPESRLGDLLPSVAPEKKMESPGKFDWTARAHPTFSKAGDFLPSSIQAPSKRVLYDYSDI